MLKRLTIAILWGLLWTAVTTFFGLLQLIILWARTLLKQGAAFELERIVMDGGLVFFAIALVTIVAVDYFSPIRLQLSTTVIMAFFVVVPFLMILSGVILYMTIYDQPSSSLNFDTIFSYERNMLGTALAYSLAIKSFVFFKEPSGHIRV